MVAVVADLRVRAHVYAFDLPAPHEFGFAGSLAFSCRTLAQICTHHPSPTVCSCAEALKVAARSRRSKYSLAGSDLVNSETSTIEASVRVFFPDLAQRVRLS